MVLALRVMELPGVQLGTSTAPDGEDVNTHANVTLPAYPLLPVAVTSELVVAPGAIVAGDAAAAESVKVGVATALTVAVSAVVLRNAAGNARHGNGVIAGGSC